MNNEKIDIIIPTYNGEKFLRQQLDSIINQTYENIRIIISDDCSKDSTPEILNEYKEKDNRIEIYIQEENLGVVRNVEFLLNKVENNFYMLSDQDDVWLQNKVEKTFEKLKSENADLVFGDLEVVDENLNTIYESFWDYMCLNKKIHKYINTYKVNYLYNCVTGCTILSKKEFIKEILPLPQKSKYLIHDHWIGLILSLKGKLTYVEEKYIQYRQHGNNEVGTRKESHSMTNLEDIRNLFINVKTGMFSSYVENNEKFPQELQELNKKSLQYFEIIRNKKHFNFQGWNIFHKLYKNENFIYYVENFIIMNMPLIGKILFKIRYLILKALKKRG